MQTSPIMARICPFQNPSDGAGSPFLWPRLISCSSPHCCPVSGIWSLPSLTMCWVRVSPSTRLCPSLLRHRTQAARTGKDCPGHRRPAASPQPLLLPHRHSRSVRPRRTSGPLLHSWHAFHKIDQPNHPTLDRFNEEAFRRRLTEAKKNPVLMDGCPAWLEKLGSEQLGEAWPAERAALAWMPALPAGQHPQVHSGRAASHAGQGACHHSARRGVETALQVTSDAALFRTQAFADGCFRAAGRRLQLVAAALDVAPGMRVIDACAGAGGKTLHLAAMMQGRGRLLAMDVEEWKLENLKQRARRAGAHNVETRVITSSKTVKRLKESADRVLLDVPCFLAWACSSATRMPSGATPPSVCRCWSPCKKKFCNVTARW